MVEQDIPFDRSLETNHHSITQLTPLVRRLIANNAGPFTFTGTCSYIVGQQDVVVIDPGPADATHRDALLRALAGRTVRAILVTHTHRDHSTGAIALRVATGAPICGPRPVLAGSVGSGLDARALDAAHDQSYAPDKVLSNGDHLSCDGGDLTALATPGHTSNHLAFVFAAEKALFSGDHVMAWSTTVIAPPDGSMGDYMTSLGKLAERDDGVYWPGHGGPVREPRRFVRALLHHRRQREQAILGRLRAGDRLASELVSALYQGLAPALRGAAALSVLAHLINLEERGRVVSEGSGLAASWQLTDDAQSAAS